MSFDAHANLALSLVGVPPSPASSGTELTVRTGDGTVFPMPPFNATVWPAKTNPSITNAEIIRVTAIVGDVFTIVRAQEGTSARTILGTDQIAATITKKTLTDIEDAIPLPKTEVDSLAYGLAEAWDSSTSTPSPPAPFWSNASSVSFNSATRSAITKVFIRLGDTHGPVIAELVAGDRIKITNTNLQSDWIVFAIVSTVSHGADPLTNMWLECNVTVVAHADGLCTPNTFDAWSTNAAIGLALELRGGPGTAGSGRWDLAGITTSHATRKLSKNTIDVPTTRTKDYLVSNTVEVVNSDYEHIWGEDGYEVQCGPGTYYPVFLVKLLVNKQPDATAFTPLVVARTDTGSCYIRSYLWNGSAWTLAGESTNNPTTAERISGSITSSLSSYVDAQGFVWMLITCSEIKTLYLDYVALDVASVAAPNGESGKGEKGDKGDPGSVLGYSSQTFAGATNYTLTGSPADVAFNGGSTPFAIILTSGTYLLIFTTCVGQSYTNNATSSLSIYNTEAAATIDGTHMDVGGPQTNGSSYPVTMQAVVTVSSSATIKVRGSGGSAAIVMAGASSIVSVQLA